MHYLKTTILLLLSALPLSLNAGVSGVTLGFRYHNDTGVKQRVYYYRQIGSSNKSYDWYNASQRKKALEISWSNDGGIRSVDVNAGQTVTHTGTMPRLAREDEIPSWTAFVDGVAYVFNRNEALEVPNRAPSISISAPGSVNSGASYTVSATGSDPDSNLTRVNLYKNGGAFTNWSGGNTGSRTVSRSTSDTGPRTVAYYAEAYDAKGVGVATSKNVTVNAPPNHAPTVSWHTIPSSVASGQSYTVRASGYDQDGNLQTIRVWKGSSAFAFTGVSGSSGVSDNNSTSDTGPKTVTFYAQSVDRNGATSSRISRNVTINAPPTYSLSVRANSGGSASGSASGLTAGTRRSISASPNSGYRFTSWSKSGAGSIDNSGAASTAVTMGSGNLTVTANFAANTYSLTIEAGTNISASLNWGGRHYDTASGAFTISGLTSGTTVSNIQSGPNTGYLFDYWQKRSGSGSFTSSGQTASFRMGNGNAVIKVFSRAAPTYSLSVRANSGGSASGSASGLLEGTRRSISASPSSGYAFSGWTKSGAGSIDNTNATSTSVTIGAGNMTVTASFIQNTYSLTVNSTSGGSASGSASGLTSGTNRTISASASTGYAFSGWTKSGAGSIANSSAASTTFTMGTGNATVTANFSARSYTLTVNSTSGGSASGGGSYAYNTSRGISASPAAGYAFSGWSKSGPGTISNSSAASTSFRMGAGNATVTANFAIQSYAITVGASTGGTTTGSGTFVYNTSHPISASAQTGYQFSGWTKVSGPGTITSAASANTTFRVGAGAAVLRANFTHILYKLTITSTAGGSATGTRTDAVYGGSYGISATPSAHYRFSGWTRLSGSATLASTTAASTNVTMGANDVAIRANFASTVQAPVSSAGGTITYGETFTPVVSGGSGNGDYQVSWGNQSSWASVTTATPAQAGSYQFYVRRLADLPYYEISDVAGPYTLVVNKANQPAVSSSGGYVQINDSFTVVVTGGEPSCTGSYQMSWDGGTTWTTAGSKTMTIPGANDFYVRKNGDINYNPSAAAGPYTVNVLVPEPRDISAKTSPTEGYKHWFDDSDSNTETFDVLPNP